MKEINRMRLLAGLPIIAEYERTEKKIVTEARTVPDDRKSKVTKSSKIMRQRVEYAKSALQHLESALTALEGIPATDYSQEIPDKIQDLEELISSDTSGVSMAEIIQDMKEDLRVFERNQTNTKKHRASKKEQAAREEEELRLNVDLDETTESVTEATRYPGGIYNDDEDPSDAWLPEVKQAMMDQGVDPKDPETKLTAVNKFEFNNIYSDPSFPHKPVHLYGNVYRMGKTKWFVTLIGQKDFSESDSTHNDNLKEMHGQTAMMLKAMGINPDKQQADQKKKKEDAKLKKAAKKDSSKKKTFFGRSVSESMHDNHDGNYPISHEDKDDPINVAKDQDDLYYKKDGEKDESPNQLKKNSFNETQKVKVPQTIKSALKTQIDEARKEAKSFERRRDYHSFNFHNNLANAFEELLAKIDEGTVYSLKEAQIFMTSLMGPMLHKLPDDVVKFVANGGTVRSLKNYMTDVSGQFPVTGEPFKNPGEK